MARSPEIIGRPLDSSFQPRTNDMLHEHDVVTITDDLPEIGLAAGDVGAVVHCYDGRDAYEVDVVDEHGRSKGVYTLAGDRLLRLNLSSLVA